MKEIESFKIDHTTLKKGLYVSRHDRCFLSCATTYDVRMKTPYSEKPLDPKTSHTIEHCLATFLRNTRDDVVYVGPMGCLTGFYVVVWGKKFVGNIRQSLADAFKWITETDTVPGASMKECGNYTFMDLEDAKREEEDEGRNEKAH